MIATTQRTTVRAAALAIVWAATVASSATGTVGARPPEIREDQQPPSSGNPSRERERDARRGDEGTATDRETRVLPLGPRGVLELRTVSGDVSVAAGGDREVRLEIVRTVRARSSEDVRRGLAEVKAVVDHQGERASVTAVYPRGRLPFRVDVSYVVTAPPGTRVTVSSVSGNVTVRDIKGDLTAAVTSGSIEIRGADRVSSARTVSGNITLVDVASQAGMSLATVSGDVRIERVRARRVDVESTSGSVRASDVACESAAVRTLSGGVDFSGDVATAGRYEFQSHSGDVALRLAGRAGFTLRASTFSGTIEPDASLALKGVTADRRSLRATAGDGSATVSATTFSGNVRIRR